MKSEFLYKNFRKCSSKLVRKDIFLNFEFYDEREKHTKDTRLKIFRSNAPYFRKFLEEKYQGTPNLKILRSKTQERLKNTLKIHKNTKNKRKNTKPKIFRNPRQIFEN